MSASSLILKIAGGSTCVLHLSRLCSTSAALSRNLYYVQKNMREPIINSKYQRNNYSTEVKSKSITQDPSLDSIPSSINEADPNISDQQQSTKSDSQPQPDKLFKKIELEILGYEPRVLDSYQWFVLAAAKNLNLEVGKVWAPHKSDKYRFNLLASVHIFKKHQIHYEVRTYHRFINIHKLTGSTADTFLEYIERNLPESVGLKVSKVEILPKPDFLEHGDQNTKFE